MRHTIVTLAGLVALPYAGRADQDFAPSRTRRLGIASGAERIEAQAVARCRFAGDRLISRAEWVTPAGTRGNPVFFYAFDCFESDSTDLETLVMTDNPPPGGCTSMLPAGYRWYFGPEYNNPFVSADLTTVTGGAGRSCEGVVHAWNWTVGLAEPDHDGDGRPDAHCFIAIQTFESMDTLGCSDDGSGFLDGLIADLGFLPSSTDPIYFLALDLTTVGFNLPMPADGVGGYQIRYFVDVPPTGDPVSTPGVDGTQHGVAAQPMLWGTADAEPINDGRAGFQNSYQFDDDAPSDGEHDPALECYDYTFGVCPDPLGATTGFLYVGAECPCTGDLNTDGMVTKEDLAILLAQFGSACPCENECIDIDRDGLIDLGDLARLLSAFGAVCP